MSRTPDTVYLHIGLHKTGTTYLQNVLRANREHCRAQGVDFPGGPGEPLQTFAVSDLLGRRPRGTDDRRVEGQWDALVTAVRSSGHKSALLSDERLSVASGKQARRVVEAFAWSDVHVVITARDLGRVSVSAWQEEIKNANTWSWGEFVAAIRDPGRRTTNPARNFWLRQDLVAVCARWAAIVGDEQVHVVTVPPSGSSPDVLLGRFCSVVGLEPARLVEPPHWNNENAGAAATEVLRQVNDRLGGRLNQRQYDKVVKESLVSTLVKSSRPTHLTVPDTELGWLEQQAEATIRELKNRDYRIVGDVDDLRPVPRQDGRHPDDVSTDEVLTVALDALAVLTERYATAWWQRKRPDENTAGRQNLRSRVRGLVFRSQRRAAGLADHNQAAARLLGVAMRVRDRSAGTGNDGSSAAARDRRQ